MNINEDTSTFDELLYPIAVIFTPILSISVISLGIYTIYAYFTPINLEIIDASGFTSSIFILTSLLISIIIHELGHYSYFKLYNIESEINILGMYTKPLDVDRFLKLSDKQQINSLFLGSLFNQLLALISIIIVFTISLNNIFESFLYFIIIFNYCFGSANLIPFPRGTDGYKIMLYYLKRRGYIDEMKYKEL